MTGTNFRHIAKYLISCVLLCLAVHVNARVFEEGEVIYVQKAPSNWSWYGDNEYHGKFAYFYKEGGSSSAWSEEAKTVDQCDDVFKIVVPAGEWTHVILTRNSVNSGPDWSNVYDNGTENVNKSADIKIPDDQNYLDNFRQYKDAVSRPESDKWHWSDCYFYRPTDDPVSVTKIGQADKEIIEVCTQSSGDPLSLQPRLINAIDGYDYIQGRTWFKWDGVKWKELPYANGDWGFSGPGGLNETIGASGSHTYYFLSSKEPAKQRFIEISVTKDCSPTCEITDFGVVTSSVNVHDSTYTLDGVVAFGDALGQTLHISVMDAKGEHHVDYAAPTTPFIFSLPNLYADGSTLIATASFLNSGCTRNSDPYEAPNAIDGIKTTTLNIKHKETSILTPSTSGTDGFKWHDGNTTEHERKIPEYCFDTTLVYTYYEYEPAPSATGNLIENGDFSADESFYGDRNRSIAIKGSAISEYNFWGKDVYAESDFYDRYKDGDNSLFGGFSIVTNANDFWKRFTDKITAKVGDRYALFDADSSGVKKAWFIDTNKSPKLKLAKGTNYMFSFWVANINNYGEMNNAAILQFAIKYKQNGSWSEEELLGNPIDLNNYKDNIWHQNSHVYTSPVDAEEVEIMVRDLNTNKNPGGNDFALDDIQFQAITVHSQAIKNCERFVVNIFEPAVTVNPPAIQIIETPACGKTDFTMQVKVGYSKLNTTYPVSLQLTDDVYGEIFTSPIEINPAVNPKEITLTLSSADYEKLVADGKEHKLTARIIRDDCHGVDKGGQNSNTYTAPGIPALTVTDPIVPTPECDQTTFDLEVKTNYAYLTGSQLLFYWDGELHSEATKTISYSPELAEPLTTTLTNLTYDGGKHTLLICTNNTTLDCQDTKDIEVPFSPYIYDYSATPEQMKCDEKTYNVTVDFFVTNGQGKNITVWGKEQSQTFAAKEGENSVTFKDIEIDEKEDYFDIWFEDAVGCTNKKTAKYTEPVMPKLENIVPNIPTSVACNTTTFDMSVTFDYINQDGTLDVNVDDTIHSTLSSPFVSNSTTIQTVTATFTGLPADGTKSRELNIVFTGGTHSCKPEPILFDAPTMPTFDVHNMAFSTSGECTDETATLIFDLEYTYQQGKLLYNVDGGPDSIKDITEQSSLLTLTGLKYEGIPADGKTDHVLNIVFNGANSCEGSFALPQAPSSPVINSVTQAFKPEFVPSEEQYHVTLTVNYSNALGKDIKIKDGETVIKSRTVNTDEGTINIQLDFDLGTSHELKVYFDGREECAKTLNVVSTVEHQTICPGDSIVGWYDEPTLYPTESMHEFVHTIEEDDKKMIITLQVSFFSVPAPIEEWGVFNGAPYVWRGYAISEPKDTTITLTTANGCKYNATLHLTEKPVENKTETMTICPGDSIVGWYDEPTLYPTESMHEFVHIIEEDDKKMIITLQVSFFSVPAPIEEWKNICEGTSYEWQGQTYTEAGNYSITLETEEGCTYPATLHLSVFPTYDMPAKDTTIIDGETYTWNGTDYETEGVYTQKLQTEHGCDSTVTLNLSIAENIVENVSFNIAEQCAGEGALEIAIQHTGYLTDAQLTFSEDAIRAGFENGTYPIINDTVTIPYNVKAGIFSVGIELWFHSRLKYSGNAPFTLLFPSSVLEQGWMDAIFVLTHDYNGGYDFTDFQWYKKGQMLVGETGPYLYQPLEIGAEYSAMLTELSGLRLMTCPIIITEHTDITLYPTIVTRKEMMRVSVTQNALLTMYSMMGEKVSTHSLTHGETQIEAPMTQGIYLAEVVLESGKRKVIKIMVR